MFINRQFDSLQPKQSDRKSKHFNQCFWGPLQQLRMPRPPTLHNEPKIVAGWVDQNPHRRCHHDERRVLVQSL